jgi:hypothetical protein
MRPRSCTQNRQQLTHRSHHDPGVFGNGPRSSEGRLPPNCRGLPTVKESIELQADCKDLQKHTTYTLGRTVPAVLMTDPYKGRNKQEANMKPIDLSSTKRRKQCNSTHAETRAA